VLRDPDGVLEQRLVVGVVREPAVSTLRASAPGLIPLSVGKYPTPKSIPV
jgi:hypothetical protein